LRRYLYIVGLMQVGWVMALSIVVCLGLGIWVDGRLDTEPLFTLFLLFVGVVVGAFAVYNTVKSSLAGIENREDE
jgi:F0F1-type ATP synthase assembly protein I